jgi:superfamily II DNA helicase RecQ
MYFQVQKKPNYLKYFLFYRGAEFRQDYGRLAEHRSILPDDVTYVALTATATTHMKSQILKKLDMMEEETSVVYELPDRKKYNLSCKEI